MIRLNSLFNYTNATHRSYISFRICFYTSIYIYLFILKEKRRKKIDELHEKKKSDRRCRREIYFPFEKKDNETQDLVRKLLETRTEGKREREREREKNSL